MLLTLAFSSQAASCCPVRVREPGEQIAGPAHTLARLRGAGTEAAPAFLVRPPPVLQDDAATGTRPVGQAQAGAEADREPEASSALLVGNEPVACTRNYSRGVKIAKLEAQVAE
jgi:hypothetical protein